MGETQPNVSDEQDPRARWRRLPARVEPGSWVPGHETEPVPGSVQVAGEPLQEEERNLKVWGI